MCNIFGIKKLQNEGKKYGGKWASERREEEKILGIHEISPWETVGKWLI